MAGDSMRTDEREHPAKPQKSAVFSPFIAMPMFVLCGQELEQDIDRS